MSGWRFEDGGPHRQQTVPGALNARQLSIATRIAPVATMVVGASPDALFLLRHTPGGDAVALVERIGAVTLEPLAASAPLAAGPVWPGGIGVHDNGDVYVVFGNRAHRLDTDLQVVASCELPRGRPYNSFVPLPDGHLVTKDFGGSRPGHEVARDDRDGCELVVLDPDLAIVDTLALDEPSIARLSADSDDVYVVADPHLLRVHWDGTRLKRDDSLLSRYRVFDGQTFGWDCVLADGAAWFLDNGDGSHNYSGTLRGHGVSTAPLHLVRVDVATGDVAFAEICGAPGGLVANPPVVDETRGVVVGYDSGNGVMTAFDIETLVPRWTRRQDHASHLLLFGSSGELVTGDHADVVILDVATGDELARADTTTGIQSVLFPAPGFADDFYLCSFMGVSRVAAVA